MPFITQNFLASTIKANGVTLLSSFSYSQLDLQDNGPINVANNLHQQKWTPTDKFTQSPEGSLQGGNLVTDGFSGNPLVPGSGFLDLENNGPSNVANYNHQQKWTPTDEYILNPQGQLQGGNLKKEDKFKIDDGNVASVNPIINVPLNNHQQIYNPLNQYEDSPQGRIRSTDSSAEKNNFKTSALDLEDPLAGINPPPGSNQGAGGGPNRTNAIQSKNGFNSGQYTVTRAGGLGIGNIAGMNGQGGGVITQTLHTYTPNNPYFEAGGLDLIPIGSAQNVNSVPFTPKNNIVESNEEQGYNATIK